MTDYLRSGNYRYADEVISALEAIDQGTVVHNIECSYMTNGAYAVLPDSQGTDGIEGVILGAQSVIVVSQTCDIRGKGADKKPMLVVAPVYRVAEINAALQGRVLDRCKYAIQLTGDTFRDEVWVADVRFEFSIEKSCLVGKATDVGFATAADRIRFAEFLGNHRSRFGVADELLELLEHLEGFVKDHALDDLVEVWVFPEPSASRATAARFLFVADGSSSDRVGEIADVLDGWASDREGVGPVMVSGLQVEPSAEVRLVETRGGLPFRL